MNEPEDISLEELMDLPGKEIPAENLPTNAKKFTDSTPLDIRITFGDRVADDYEAELSGKPKQFSHPAIDLDDLKQEINQLYTDQIERIVDVAVKDGVIYAVCLDGIKQLSVIIDGEDIEISMLNPEEVDPDSVAFFSKHLGMMERWKQAMNAHLNS